MSTMPDVVSAARSARSEARKWIAEAVPRHLRPSGRVLVAGVDEPPRGLVVDAGAVVVLGATAPGGCACLGAATDIPFADQSFDVVVGALRSTSDAGPIVRELVRVTVPGGTVILEVADRIRVRGLDLVEAERLAGLNGHRLDRRNPMVVAVRVPGPRRGRMPIRVEGLEGLDHHRVRRLLADLPQARGYSVVVKPLRWRSRPHVQAFCDFAHRRITIQVPVPFEAFDEDIPYRAKRVGRGRRFRFRWFWRRVRFERPDELIRYLYLHEYYHWYLREVLGRRSGAETACDRFALQRFAIH